MISFEESQKPNRRAQDLHIPDRTKKTHYLKLRTCDNGDIFAEAQDGALLMGVWFHAKQFGTIRISGAGDPTYDNEIVCRRDDLTTWLTEMVDFNTHNFHLKERQS